MKHADKLIARILFMEGLPSLQDLNKLLIDENVEEMLNGDLQLEQAARPLYQQATACCGSCGDYISRELLEVHTAIGRGAYRLAGSAIGAYKLYRHPELHAIADLMRVHSLSAAPCLALTPKTAGQSAVNFTPINC